VRSGLGLPIRFVARPPEDRIVALDARLTSYRDQGTGIQRQRVREGLTASAGNRTFPTGRNSGSIYVADIGDGQTGTYATAFLCQDDLFVEGSFGVVAGARSAVGRPPSDFAAGALPAGWSRLPRGELLLLDGETAYPLADDPNLAAHVREPFTWAFRDLEAKGRPVWRIGIALAMVAVTWILLRWLLGKSSKLARAGLVLVWLGHWIALLAVVFMTSIGVVLEPISCERGGPGDRGRNEPRAAGGRRLHDRRLSAA
jgi:hypothetical protein